MAKSVGNQVQYDMDHVGAKTLEIMSAAPWYNKWIVDKFKRYLSGSILEAGAGVGNITKLLQSYGKVTAIDYDRGYVKTLKKEGFDAGFGDIERGTFFFGEKKFDSIVSTNVIEHIEKDEKAIENLARHLKKNGRLIILVPAHMWAYGAMDRGLGHFRRYNKKALSHLFSGCGLRVIEARYLNWFGIFGWVLAGRILRKKVIPGGQLKIFSFIAPLLLKIEDFVRMPFGLSVLVVGEKR